MKLPIAISAILLVVAAPAAAQSVIVLKTSAAPSAPDRAGRVTITLASGATITVPASDIHQPAAPAVTADGRLTPPLTKSRQEKCAAEHATDFQLRAYCEKMQGEAESRLRARSMSGGNRATIRATCAKDWPDDAQMRDYCEEQQLKALGSLGLPR